MTEMTTSPKPAQRFTAEEVLAEAAKLAVDAAHFARLRFTGEAERNFRRSAMLRAYAADFERPKLTREGLAKALRAVMAGKMQIIVWEDDHPIAKEQWLGRADEIIASVCKVGLGDRYSDYAGNALLKLQERVRVLEDALKFYAAEGTWLDDIAPDPAGTPVPYTAPVWGDMGDKAKSALTPTEKETKP